MMARPGVLPCELISEDLKDFKISSGGGGGAIISDGCTTLYPGGAGTHYQLVGNIDPARTRVLQTSRFLDGCCWKEKSSHLPEFFLGYLKTW